MKTLMGLGKLLTVLFWYVVLANLFTPFAQPFAPLVSFAGAGLLGLHALQLLLYGARLSAQSSPWLSRVLVLVFGIFHLYRLPEPATLSVTVNEVAHA